MKKNNSREKKVVTGKAGSTRIYLEDELQTLIVALLFVCLIGIDASPHSTSDFALTLNPECAKGQVYWCQDLA